MVHDLELALHLGDLVLRLDEVFAVEVAVAPHALVQLLLLLELHLPVADLVAELVDAHLTELRGVRRVEEGRGAIIVVR